MTISKKREMSEGKKSKILNFWSLQNLLNGHYTVFFLSHPNSGPFVLKLGCIIDDSLFMSHKL